MADLDKRNNRSKSPKPIIKKKVLPTEPEKELEEYPVWVIDSQTFIPYAASLTNEYSFKAEGKSLNFFSQKVLEVKEGDKVTIKLKGLKHQIPPKNFVLQEDHGEIPLYSYPPNIKSLDDTSIPRYFEGVTTKPLNSLNIPHDFTVRLSSGQ